MIRHHTEDTPVEPVKRAFLWNGIYIHFKACDTRVTSCFLPLKDQNHHFTNSNFDKPSHNTSVLPQLKHNIHRERIAHHKTPTSRTTATTNLPDVSLIYHGQSYHSAIHVTNMKPQRQCVSPVLPPHFLSRPPPCWSVRLRLDRLRTLHARSAVRLRSFPATL